MVLRIRPQDISSNKSRDSEAKLILVDGCEEILSMPVADPRNYFAVLGSGVISAEQAAGTNLAQGAVDLD